MPLSMTPTTMFSPRSLRSARRPPTGSCKPRNAALLFVLQVLVRVLPDALDLGALREPRHLRGRQPRREAVDGVAVAVDLRARGADAAEQPIVRSARAASRRSRRPRRAPRCACSLGFVGRRRRRHALVARGARAGAASRCRRREPPLTGRSGPDEPQRLRELHVRDLRGRGRQERRRRATRRLVGRSAFSSC